MSFSTWFGPENVTFWDCSLNRWRREKHLANGEGRAPRRKKLVQATCTSLVHFCQSFWVPYFLQNSPGNLSSAMDVLAKFHRNRLTPAHLYFSVCLQVGTGKTCGGPDQRNLGRLESKSRVEEVESWVGFVELALNRLNRFKIPGKINPEFRENRAFHSRFLGTEGYRSSYLCPKIPLPLCKTGSDCIRFFSNPQFPVFTGSLIWEEDSAEIEVGFEVYSSLSSSLCS